MSTATQAHGRAWQVGKSLSQCNGFMFDNQVACDIKFVVNSTGGSTVSIPAHKYMLMCRSPVFEAMFCGEYRETLNDVVITDIEPDIFREMLRFIYTDQVSVTAHNVLFLLAAARKYLLDLLADTCVQYLVNNINVESACTILSHSVLQGEVKLVRTCLDYIAPRTVQILKTEAFLEMSQASLKVFLECDDLVVDSEVDIFEACKAWAEYNAKEDVSDKVMRETLGECLFNVRFDSMACKEFHLCLGFSTILNDKEVRLFNMCSSLKDENLVARAKEQLTQLGYNCHPRRSAPRHVLRRVIASRNPTEYWTTSGEDKTDAIGFRVSHAIQLLGVSVFCGKSLGAVHSCTLRVTDGVTDLSTETSTTITSDGVEDQQTIMLSSPVVLQPCIDHCVAVTMTGPDTYRGCLGDSLIEKEGIVFTFSTHADSTNHTNVEQGQIPEIIFRPYDE